MDKCHRCNKEFDEPTIHKINGAVCCSRCFDSHVPSTPVPITEGVGSYNSGNWVEGWYEHIDRHPIYIRDKEHLKQECAKRGLMARSLMKPKSQGRGYEMR